MPTDLILTPLPIDGLPCSEFLPNEEILPCSDGPVLILTPLS